MNEDTSRRCRTALKVRQWLRDWDDITWRPDENRRKPPSCFYQFCLPAEELRALSGVYPRSTRTRARGSEDRGIQRRHDSERSKEIMEFVKYGFPWSRLAKVKRKSGQFHDLRQPGWLPTAIVVNILTKRRYQNHGSCGASRSR